LAATDTEKDERYHQSSNSKFGGVFNHNELVYSVAKRF